jgi:hypothetical protein
MLRVTIELVPYGIEKHAKKIATMLIANNGDGDWEFGDYDFAYNYLDNPEAASVGILKGFPRRLGAWSLLKGILSVNENNQTELTDILCDTLKKYRENGYQC